METFLKEREIMPNPNSTIEKQRKQALRTLEKILCQWSSSSSSLQQQQQHHHHNDDNKDQTKAAATTTTTNNNNNNNNNNRWHKPRGTIDPCLV
jgi:hypothetical protein